MSATVSNMSAVGSSLVPA